MAWSYTMSRFDQGCRATLLKTGVGEYIGVRSSCWRIKSWLLTKWPLINMISTNSTARTFRTKYSSCLLVQQLASSYHVYTLHKTEMLHTTPHQAGLILNPCCIQEKNINCFKITTPPPTTQQCIIYMFCFKGMWLLAHDRITHLHVSYPQYYSVNYYGAYSFYSQ